MYFEFLNVKIKLHPTQSFLIYHDKLEKVSHNHDDGVPTSPLDIMNYVKSCTA